MKPSLFKIIFASILALSLLGGFTLKATAAPAVPKYLSIIKFTQLPSIGLGEPFTLSGYIKTWFGAPVADEDVSFTVDRNQLGQARTDLTGFFQRKFTNVFNAGTYTILATTKGSHNFIGATGSTSLQILPADVRIQTVPAVSGITFNMAGENFISGPDGVADIKIGAIGRYLLTALVGQYNNPDQRVEFARWLDETYQPSQTVQVPTSKTLELGLNVYQKVGETFVDMSGFPVNPQRVKQFTIRSAQGDVFVLTNGQPHWIPASRVARFQNGLVATDLEYSVISMMVDGSNVVNKSQQRFFVHANDTWQISLILYTLNIRANDGLFGSSVGKSVNLVYPDGHFQSYPLAQDGTASIHALARGNYTVQVLDAKGLKQIIPVALSRSQTVDIHVPTNLDLIIIILVGLVVALSLILFGRRRSLLSHLRATVLCTRTCKMPS